MMGRIQSRSQSPRYPCLAERVTGNEIGDASSHPFRWYCYCACVGRAGFSRAFTRHSNGIQTKKKVTQRIEIKALD